MPSPSGTGSPFSSGAGSPPPSGAGSPPPSGAGSPFSSGAGVCAPFGSVPGFSSVMPNAARLLDSQSKSMASSAVRRIRTSADCTTLSCPSSAVSRIVPTPFSAAPAAAQPMRTSGGWAVSSIAEAIGANGSIVAVIQTDKNALTALFFLITANFIIILLYKWLNGCPSDFFNTAASYRLSPDCCAAIFFQSRCSSQRRAVRYPEAVHRSAP